MSTIRVGAIADPRYPPSMGTVVDFPMSPVARARVTIHSCAAEYARAPTVENGRELVFSVQAYWDHLGALGFAKNFRAAFLDNMDATTTNDEVVLACANAVLRALKSAERRAAAR